MKRIDYVCLCNKGYLRSINQDNFLVDNQYLEKNNNGLESPLSGSLSVANLPVFSVFDGMGGACSGEIAAYISADTLFKFDSKHNISSAGMLNTAFMEMNRNVCEYMEENKISTMGSTSSVLLFKSDEYIACNLGDSPIFKYTNGRLTKISSEHTGNENFLGSKPGLTQYIGIPEEEFVIEPYFKTDTFNKGDRFLICSDGLTDMVSNFEIGNIIATGDIKTSAQKLMDTALENGGKDNITIVLCEVKEGKV